MSTTIPTAEESKGLVISGGEKSFTLFQAITLVVVSTLVFFALGSLVGKAFFWKSTTEVRIEQQIAYFKAKAEAEPKNPDNRVKLAYTYILQKDYNEALKNLQVALAINPKHKGAYYNMGLAYQGQKNFDKALESFNKALKLSPRDYQSLYQMGVIYNEKGNYKAAAEALQKAYKEKRGSADIIYQIAVSTEKMGNKQRAITLYKEALKYDPNYEEAKSALASLQ
jgi:tetratricopeptide (TPR) repeat protein